MTEAARNVLHRDERAPIRLANLLVHRADVRMVEMRQRPRFVEEPAACRIAVSVWEMEKLQGDIAVQRRVVGAIDNAHAAGADELDNLVTAEGQPNHDLRNLRNLRNLRI